MPYFQFSKSERRGVIVLCAILLLVVGVVWFASSNKGETSSPSSPIAERRQGSQPHHYAQPKRKVETFDFDPNTADSTTLLRLGLAPYMVRSIYKYRSMGGVYSAPEDFTRVPGMTNEMWERLKPHIRIAHRFQRVEPQYNHNKPSPSAPSTGRDTTTMRYTQKLRQGETVELNGSDTTALKKIPGIGSYYARQIVRYRERLGGFVSIGQVKEVEGVPYDIEQYLTLGNATLRKMDVNHATKGELMAHPYINSYQAQSIWDYRRLYGTLRGIDDLSQLSNFTKEDIQRLAPYLEYK